PAIAIEQRNTTRSSRSTVGTATEIYDYLRLLFARLGRTVCPNGHGEVKRYAPDEVIDALLASHRGRTLMVIATRKLEKGSGAKQVDEMIREGYARFIIKGEVVRLESAPKNASRLATIDLVLDRIDIEEGKRARLHEAIDTAYRMTDGHVRFEDVEGGKPLEFTNQLVCTSCGTTFEEPRPILFSFNTPFGACPSCRGFGSRLEFDDALIIPDTSKALKDHAVEPWASEKFEYFFNQLVRFCRRKKIPMNVPWAKLPAESRRAIMSGSGEYVGVLPFLENMREKTYKKYARFFTRRYLAFRGCRACEGGRLRPEAFYVHLGGRTIRDIAAMTPGDALAFVRSLQLNERESTIARDVVIELESRLGFLVAVGLHYITLDRLARTLSGGESQRISLANSLGSNLLDVLYVLDEPSIGLHPRDTVQLIEVLSELRARGNTVVVVEHDLDIIRAADYIVDLGPGAGEHGGSVVYQGAPDAGNAGSSGTLRYLTDGLPFRNGDRMKTTGPALKLTDVREHNLKNMNVAFPLHAF
ncbi:MAG TPA: excinuclease ABC subunit A, partial [Candidatus Krumholzibacteria bacterium]|nr:excinuclease ABC subunit A [Candidatus Krumholzibacteria bacterium]